MLIVKEALAGNTPKEIKKRLKRDDVKLKVKDIVEQLAAYGFMYDDEEAKWVQIMPQPFTAEEIVKLKGLISEEAAEKLEEVAEEVDDTSADHIEEATATFTSDNRKSKTFYIDQNIAQQVKEFADEKGVRISNFVEIALLDALKKYK